MSSALSLSMLGAVAAGGAAGAVARYVSSVEISRRFGTDIPLATFVVNIIGSAVLGICFALLANWLTAVVAAEDAARSGPGSAALSQASVDHIRALVMVGFLGAFTTFSTFSMELVLLMESGRLQTALLYGFGSLLAGCIAFAAGLLFTRALLG